MAPVKLYMRGMNDVAHRVAQLITACEFGMEAAQRVEQELNGEVWGDLVKALQGVRAVAVQKYIEALAAKGEEAPVC